VLKVADVPLGTAGGINIFMRKTGDVTAAQGHIVEYIFQESLAPRAIPRFLGRRVLVPWLIALKVLWRSWRSRNYDVVEIHEPAAIGYCAISHIGLLRLPPCVVISYGAAERQWQAVLERCRALGQHAPLKSRILVPLTLLPQSRYAFLHAKHVLVSSDGDARYVHTLGVPWERIGRADSGVGREYFELERTPRGERLRLLFIGTWIDRKGVRELVEAWSLLAPRHPTAALSVTCAAVEEGRVVRSLGVHNERVTVKPYLSEDELKAELVRHDVFVLPAWFEGGAPLALLQAAAAGLACVVTEIGGHTDVFGISDPEASGALMIPPHDGEALTRSIERLASESGLLERLGANARAHARNFSWDRQAERQLAGYRAAVGQGSTKPGDVKVEQTQPQS
jgi:glycosyltransferase involved in cell wall biosynthesis